VLFIFYFLILKILLGVFYYNNNLTHYYLSRVYQKPQKMKIEKESVFFLLENDIKKKCHLLLLFSFYFWDFFYYDNTPYPLSLQKTQK